MVKKKKRRGRPRLPEAYIQQIRDLAAEGRTRDQAATILGKSYDDISNATKRHKIAFKDDERYRRQCEPIPGPLPAYPKQEQARIYILAGYRDAAIARKVGYTRERIRQLRRDISKDLAKRAVRG